MTGRLRRWMATWGITGSEASRALPGDDVISGGIITATNAITIDAPAGRVWPWIVQMGRGRGGFYTYTWIENLLGAGIRNLDHIEPAYQRLTPGERIWLTPERYLGRPGQYWRVHSIEPGHSLVLAQSPPANPSRCTWALVAQPAGEHRTRLLSRHWAERPQGFRARISNALWGAGSFIMERGALRGLKRRAEANPGPARQPARPGWRRSAYVLVSRGRHHV